MDRRGELIFSGNVAMTSEATTGILDVPIPEMTGSEGEQVLVCLKNSAAIDATCVINNVVTFISTAEVVPLDDSFTIAASSNTSKIVTGFPNCEGGRLSFTKASGTAMTIYVRVYRA